MSGDSDIKKRIDELIEALGLSTRKFSLLVSNSDSFARNIRDSIGSEKIGNILRVFPQVNLYWLITGEGEMFRNSSTLGDNNTISNSNLGVVSGGQFVGGNNLNITLPEAGTQKIIKPDGTVIIEKLTPVSSRCEQGNTESLLETIELQKQLINSHKITIDLLLKEREKSSS